jgi:hypothetical protein
MWTSAYIKTEQFTDFPGVEIELGFHHILSLKCDPVRLNVRDAMEWLTERADFKNIVENDRFVVKYYLIEELAASDTTVRLFDCITEASLSALLCLLLPYSLNTFIITSR